MNVREMRRHRRDAMHCMRDVHLLRRLHVWGTIRANANPIIDPAGKCGISAEGQGASDRHRLQANPSLYPAGLKYMRDDIGSRYPCSGGTVEHGSNNMHTVRAPWDAAMQFVLRDGLWDVHDGRGIGRARFNHGPR